MLDWSILGIDPTTELINIKRAYARKVKEYHPEDDPKGFQRLREAYEMALERAAYTGDRSEIISLNSINIEEKNSEAAYRRAYPHNKDAQNPLNSTDQFIFKFMESVRILYQETLQRNNKDEWKKLLKDEMLWSIDIKQALYYQVSAFLQENHEIPYEVIVLLNGVFRWTEEPDELWDIFFNEDEIIALAKESNHKATKLRAATLLFYRGISLQNIERIERALKYYDEAEEMLSDSIDTEDYALHIKIIFNRGVAFGNLAQYEKAIEAYDNLLSLFESSSEISVKWYKACALFYKGRMLDCLQKKWSAFETYSTLVFTYANEKDKQIKEVVHAATQEIKKVFAVDVLIIFLLLGFLFKMNPRNSIGYILLGVILISFLIFLRR